MCYIIGSFPHCVLSVRTEVNEFDAVVSLGYRKSGGIFLRFRALGIR